jgi:hypothetical protein
MAKQILPFDDFRSVSWEVKRFAVGVVAALLFGFLAKMFEHPGPTVHHVAFALFLVYFVAWRLYFIFVWAALFGITLLFPWIWAKDPDRRRWIKRLVLLDIL